MPGMTDHSKPGAVLFDIYQTLLTVEAPPADAEMRWSGLWTEALGSAPRLSLVQVDKLTREVVDRHHAAARALGIAWPEVHWPDVMREAVSELGRLSGVALDAFLFGHAQLQRTVCLAQGAAALLRGLAERHVPLGLVSNAQAYTLQELDMALGQASMSRALFRSELCFLSFQNGYSKPDPHVFRSLGARLRTEGIGTDRILMVGDREDNDIAPARAQGWGTWRMTRGISKEYPEAGDFEQLGRFLKVEVRNTRQ
jgi:FMN phosphatase YigB (HAD superfamily)